MRPVWGAKLAFVDNTELKSRPNREVLCFRVRVHAGPKATRKNYGANTYSLGLVDIMRFVRSVLARWPHAKPQPTNGSTIRTPAFTKSARFRVTTARPWTIAVAAMRLSLIGMAFPAVRRRASSSAHFSPVSASHGRQWRRPAPASNQRSRVVRFLPLGRMRIPNRSSGFWLARWLIARGIEAYVIHSASVAVSRERKRAKTDRLDAAMLMRVFLGWLRGERGHCGMVAIPTMEEEDARRPSRERESLVNERSRITNRMKSALARLGVRGFKPHLRKAPERLADLRTAEGTGLPANIIEEFRRDMARLHPIRFDVREVLTIHTRCALVGAALGQAGWPLFSSGNLVRRNWTRRNSGSFQVTTLTDLIGVYSRRSTRQRHGTGMLSVDYRCAFCGSAEAKAAEDARRAERNARTRPILTMIVIVKTGSERSQPASICGPAPFGLVLPKIHAGDGCG